MIETSPPRIPFVKAEKLYLRFVLPPSFYSTANTVIPATDGEIIVFIIARDAETPASPTDPKLEPPLNIIHPTQRIIVPKTTECGLEGANALSYNFY